ncbi:hypothetical protein PN836_016550 [Ningiella sp. W23]|uniref:hypothetical protein n=1 Tax=Ningiella sp. W23 TaxID=3023715 RepID=UPI0037562F4A
MIQIAIFYDSSDALNRVKHACLCQPQTRLYLCSTGSDCAVSSSTVAHLGNEGNKDEVIIHGGTYDECLNQLANAIEPNTPLIIATDSIVPKHDWWEKLSNFISKNEAGSVFGRWFDRAIKERVSVSNDALGHKFIDCIPKHIGDHIYLATEPPQSNCVRVGAAPIFFNWFAVHTLETVKQCLATSSGLDEFAKNIGIEFESSDFNIYYNSDIECISQALLTR